MDNFKKNLAESIKTYETITVKSNIQKIYVDYMDYSAKVKADPSLMEKIKADFSNTHPKPLTPEEAKIVEPFILTSY